MVGNRWSETQRQEKYLLGNRQYDPTPTAYDPATNVPIHFYSHEPLNIQKREKPMSWAKTHKLMGDIETYF